MKFNNHKELKLIAIKKVDEIKAAFYETTDEDGKEKFRKVFYEYLEEICISYKQASGYAISLLLKDLVFNPLKSLSECESSKEILCLLEELGVADSLTFLMSQVSECCYLAEELKIILGVLKDSPHYNIYSLYLFRLNPDYIYSTVEIMPDMLSPKELYLGISGGYFFYCGNKKAAEDCLLNLVKSKTKGAEYWYKRLIMEGFKL